MCVLKFAVGDHEVKIESLLIVGLQRLSDAVTTVVLRDDTTIDVHGGFDTVYDRVRFAAEEPA